MPMYNVGAAGFILLRGKKIIMTLRALLKVFFYDEAISPSYQYSETILIFREITLCAMYRTTSNIHTYLYLLGGITNQGHKPPRY